jgi:hypothetical protein
MLGPTATTCLSDVRLICDISCVGFLENGLRLYRFRYLWSVDHFIGVLAQEVRQILPEAVIERDDGYLAVDCEMLGFSMFKVDDWMDAVAASEADEEEAAFILAL